MFSLFKNTPEPFPIYADAAKYHAAGYEVVPVELSRATAGLETPMAGPWGFGGGVVHEANYPYNVPAILGARLPWTNGQGFVAGSISMDQLRARWVAFVRLDVHNNAKIAQACEAIVRSIAGAGPVRLTAGSTALLLPYRMADVTDDPRRYALTTGSIGCPGDTLATGSSCVTVAASGASFVVGGGPWSWRDGRDLLAVPYAELPTLSVTQAVAIVTECRGLLEAKRPKPAPTPLQLRVQAARRRAQTEHDTVDEA